jgi:N-acetylglucosaminyldiphosphoundecaprenol N-acetyl-beta-D-mannosaminyltransferase
MLGIDINAMRMSEVLDLCEQHIADRSRLLIGVVNVAKAVNIQKDATLRKSISDADIVLADGAGIVLLSRLTGQPLPERVTGIDLMYNLMQRADRHRYRIFFLGATEAVITNVVDHVRDHYPNLQIAGFHDGYFKPDQEEPIAHQIRDSKADILFVAMTSPQKENFLNRWRTLMDVPICHGVGGSFDIVAGLTRRAPQWMQKCGLEWLYRVYQEPGRMWKRYLVTNTVFLVLGLREVVFSSVSKSSKRLKRVKL